MRHRTLVLALPALLSCAVSLPSLGEPPPAWQRAWTLESYECPRCSREDRAWLEARRQQQIVLGASSFVNPFYETCATGADYTDIRPRSRAEVRTFLGGPPLMSLGEATPLAGTVRCVDPSGTPNTVARIVIDGASAFLLHESGAVLRLR